MAKFVTNSCVEKLSLSLSMSGGRLLACLTALVVVIHLPQISNANQCEPSSCGNILNISHPFRLTSDPQHCGNPSYELGCENNLTPVVYLNSSKYYVQAINYHNFTIRLVDADVLLHNNKDNCSSFPRHSLTQSNFSFEDDPYSTYIYKSERPYQEFITKPINYLSCQNPVDSPRYVKISACMNGVNFASSNSSRTHSYVVIGSLNVSDVRELCTIDLIHMTSWPGVNEDEGNNHSFAQLLHTALLYGFELSWYMDQCGKNCSRRTCYLDQENHLSCYAYDKLGILGVLLVILSDILSYIYLVPYRLPIYFTYGYGNTQYRNRLSHIYPYDYEAPYPLLYIAPFLDLATLVIGLNIAMRIVCGIPLGLTVLIYKLRRRHLSMFNDIEDYLRSQNNLTPIRYSYSQIKKMTNDFKDKLGEGGYGSVYKGKLRSGSLVAIKLLSKPKANGQEFINEVATIGRIHHVNVVQLIGYCAERSKRALVYDFMPNGSLEKYIFLGEEETLSLSCEKMYKVTLGVARGIEYLHRGCDIQILHFDIKPHNILLDQNFTPKVSDFGLAKLYPTDDSIVSLTAARGTMGYMAPELFYKNIGGVSYKVDVYSFGMLLLEMVGRRKNLNAFADHSSQIFFPLWVYDQINKGKVVEVGYATEEETKAVKKMIIVALWCIQMKPSDRPSMSKVVQMLEENGELLQMPPKPFLCPEEMPAEDLGIDTDHTELPIQLGDSVNSVSFDISTRPIAEPHEAK